MSPCDVSFVRFSYCHLSLCECWCCFISLLHLLSLNAVLKMRPWASALLQSALKHKLHHYIIASSLFSIKVMIAHPASVRRQQCERACQAASVLSANQELRKRIHLWGSVLSCLREFKRDGWMEKAKGETPPVLQAELDGRGKENPFSNLILRNWWLIFISYVTEDERSKLCVVSVSWLHALHLLPIIKT